MRVILKRPLVTEKMTNLQDQRQYAFEVDLKANKVEIAKAVEKKFNVTVESVRNDALQRKAEGAAYSARKVFRVESKLEESGGHPEEG